MLKNKNSYYFSFPLIITIMIATLLFIGSQIRSNTYQTFQNQLAQKSVTGASNELRLYISELRRSVRLFADQEKSLIERLSKDNADISRYKQLEEKVRRHFPEHFAFTIASSEGKALLEGLDTLAGKGCRRDIAQFSKDTDSHKVYVHSSPFDNPYHFDIMVPWGDDDGIFFISFNLKNVTQILKNAETINHNLILLKNDKHGLIELTSKGAIDSLKEKNDLTWMEDNYFVKIKNKHDFRLGSDNIEKIEYEDSVNGTLWTLADLPDTNLYSNVHKSIRLHHISIFLLFCFVIYVMTYFLFTARNKLYIAMNKLQVANNQKDKLFSIIAHDLRAPFSPIKGFAGLLIGNAEKYSPEEVINHATIINTSSDRALDLLEKLLDWAKLQIDGYPIVIEKVNIKDTALDIIDLYSAVAAEKNCTLQYESQNITVLADVNALDTIIRNLVSNAIKFTSNGSITIGADVHDDSTTVYVKDSGIGINEETRQKLFDDTNYITTNGTSGEKGTGLGLSICKELVNKLNGQIAVDSTPGVGTTFYIILPNSRK